MHRLSYTFIFFLGFAWLISGCKKNKSEITQTAEPQAPPVPVALSLHDNVRVLDTASLDLNTNPNLLHNGVYAFTFSGADPGIKPGDVIVGAHGDGFIR